MQTQRPSLGIYHGDNAGGRRKERFFLEVQDVTVMLMEVYYMGTNGDRKHSQSLIQLGHNQSLFDLESVML